MTRILKMEIFRESSYWANLLVCSGEGNGTPLQYSCLENPMDGRAWWAAVHGVPKSRTRLSDFLLTFHFHALEKEMATHSSVLPWRIPGTGEPGGLPIYGVAQSRTRLKQLSSSSSSWSVERVSQVVLVVKKPSVNIGAVRNAGLIPGSGRSPGGGHHNPLQYSCLENPMDRRAWWAAVHRVAKNQTWLKRLSMHAWNLLVSWLN